MDIIIFFLLLLHFIQSLRLRVGKAEWMIFSSTEKFLLYKNNWKCVLSIIADKKCITS